MQCAVAVLMLVTPMLRAQTAAPAAAATHEAGDLTGNWQGMLIATPPDPAIRTLLKIAKDDKGALSGMMYRVDQPGWAAPVTAISVQGKTITFAVTPQDVTYEGKLSADGGLMTGTWKHGPTTHVMNLLRVAPEAAWEIPPPPAPPKAMPADADPAFDVATIKPSDPNVRGNWFTVRGRNFSTHNISLAGMMKFAYGVHAKQLVNGPDWFDKDTYDLNGVPDGEGQPSDKQWKTMMKKLMADRFGLTFHIEKRELAVFALTVGKDGPKNMTADADGGPLPSLFFQGTPGGIMLPVRNATMADFTGLFQEVVLDKPVVDQTGLKGRFDFTIKWAPAEGEFGGHGPPPGEVPDAPPGLFTAIQEQIGLKLDTTRTMVEVMVIDHVEKPSAN
jgi:uncharacterized protein (TIGR03435 family)